MVKVGEGGLGIVLRVSVLVVPASLYGSGEIEMVHIDQNVEEGNRGIRNCAEEFQRRMKRFDKGEKRVQLFKMGRPGLLNMCISGRN